MKRYKGQKKNQKSFVHYFYSIPANKEGKLFIKLLKKYLNKARYKIRVKGRGSRKEHGNGQNLPLKHAEHYAVYIDIKTLDENNPSFYYDLKWKTRLKLSSIKTKLNEIDDLL